MVIFLSAAVTISVTRAAGCVGKLNQDPRAPEGFPGLNGFWGPAIPSHFFFVFFFYDFFFVSVIFGYYIKSVLTFNEISMS